MVKKILQKLINKSGKSYKIDDRIPNGLFYSVIITRVFMRIRGYLRTGRPVFLGRSCNIRNAGNISFGRNVTIEEHCRIDGYASRQIILGDNVKIGAYSLLTCTSHMSKLGLGLRMGNNSAIGDFAHFGASGGIEIGNDVIMGSYISFHSENHNFEDSARLIREQGTSSKGIVIGNNVWVGAKVTFLDGCSVGDNSVVAAGAVVTQTFPSNSVVGGVPAKVIKTLYE